MTYTTPTRRSEAVQRALDRLSQATNVVLSTHLNADGDGAGSEVALAAWLRDRGVESWIVNPTPFPDRFRFLVPESGWVLDATSPQARETCTKADLAVVVDTGEVPRLGRVKPMIEDLPKVVVDHHPPGDQSIEGTKLIDPSASATGELVYDLIAAAGAHWTPVADLAIYVAIMTDTGSFRFSNATADCHRLVAELVERGVDPEQVHRRVYGVLEPRGLRLLQASLEELELDERGAVAWMTVPLDAYRSLGATPDDLEGLVDYPRSLKGIEVGILFRALEDGATKISLRSNGSVDVNDVARRFGGGGHVKAAGALVARPLEEVRSEVVAATLNAVTGTSS